jgi:ribonuclease J
MVKITLYGGVSEVGGNKILVDHQGTRVMLDFGTRMGFASEFFSDFLDVRTNTEMKDKMTIGLLPKIPGIYRNELLRPGNLEELENTNNDRIISPDSKNFMVPGLVTYEDYFKKYKRGYIDCIFLTHAHLDHTGDIGFIHQDIPLFCSKDTHKLVKAIDEVTSFPSNALVMKGMNIGLTGTGATFPGTPKLDKSDIRIRQVNPLDDGGSVTLGSIRATLHEVDHSVPGAASYVLECKADDRSVRILYTGDIRFHGNKGTTIDDYVQSVGDNIDILLLEGTRIGSRLRLTEDEVREKITQEIKSTQGLVFVDFSWKDATRYETILTACRAAGRKFNINARLAYILDKLGFTPLPEDVKVFLKRKYSCTYSPSDYSSSKYEYGFSVEKETWMNDASHYQNGITAEEIKSNPGKYVLMLSYYDLGQVFDLAGADGKIPNSRFIRAQCEPFCDEMELDEERLINWLETFGIEYEPGETPVPDDCTNPDCEKLRERIARSHVSGHASQPELKEVIQKIKPKILIPVHTPHPELFQDIVDELSDEMEIDLRLPELGKTMSFE